VTAKSDTVNEDGLEAMSAAIPRARRARAAGARGGRTAAELEARK
jgi:hypothetical protein